MTGKDCLLELRFSCPCEDLSNFSKAVLQKMDVSPADAEVVSAALVDADLRGWGPTGSEIDPLFQALSGRSDQSRPRIRMISESSSHFLLDNDYGLGFLGSVRRWTCASAWPKDGIAMAGVRNSSHFGAAGYYALMAAEQNLVGFAASNSYPVMAAAGHEYVGAWEQPFCLCFPRREAIPHRRRHGYQRRFAGKIKQYANEGKPIPLGWLMTAKESPPKTLGVLLARPFGEEGYKGYGLALALDILAGVLTGSFFAQNFISGPGPGDAGIFFWPSTPNDSCDR